MDDLPAPLTLDHLEQAIRHAHIRHEGPRAMCYLLANLIRIHGGQARVVKRSTRTCFTREDGAIEYVKEQEQYGVRIGKHLVVPHLSLHPCSWIHVLAHVHDNLAGGANPKLSAESYFNVEEEECVPSSLLDLADASPSMSSWQKLRGALKDVQSGHLKSRAKARQLPELPLQGVADPADCIRTEKSRVLEEAVSEFIATTRHHEPLLHVVSAHGAQAITRQVLFGIGEMKVSAVQWFARLTEAGPLLPLCPLDRWDHACVRSSPGFCSDQRPGAFPWSQGDIQPISGEAWWMSEGASSDNQKRFAQLGGMMQAAHLAALDTLPASAARPRPRL